MINKFKKKPVIIEAVQFTGDNVGLIKEFTNYNSSIYNGELIIHTFEGNMIASVGDWIIKGVKGEFYPCKPDIFEMTYEKCEKKIDMEENYTCELCFWDDVDQDVQCEKCGRYFCEDCGSYGECICNSCKDSK